jgi:hypothetical protein
MKEQRVYRFVGTIAIVFFILITSGCGGNLPATQPPAASPEPLASASPVAASTAALTPEGQVPVSGANALYEDDFTDPATGWPEDKFDNYFVGYHEPEYYHIEVTSPHYKTTIFEPDKQSYGDFSVDLQVLTAAAKTAAEGDFRYGLAFRRAGDQYYAFTISPRTKKWFFLKSSPNQLEVVSEGTDAGIHEIDVDDVLRVDAQGSQFFLHINDQLVGQVTEAAYASGEIGFYVESFDSLNTHIHFNDLTIRNFEAPPVDEASGSQVLYEDDFTNPTTGWTERTFDNYFIGYHEPEYYHVEITGTNYKTTVFEPGKQSFNDFTVELAVLTAASRTAADGNFRYGIAFRRAGDQYYAFVISPRTRQWSVLKSSPSGLQTLAEGTEAGIHELDVDDTLRVDAQGSDFLFHINDKLVGQVSDAEYTGGEIGFYVESFDSPQTHIHFDQLTIRDLELPLRCSVINQGTLYVRTGPGKTYAQIAVLSDGDTVQSLGISPDREWIKIRLEGSEGPGWVGNTEGYLSCTPSIDLFPTVNP